MITHLDLFSGVGGFTLAFRWACESQKIHGRTIAFCEIEPYAQQVLQKKFGAVMADARCKRRERRRIGGGQAPTGEIRHNWTSNGDETIPNTASLQPRREQSAGDHEAGFGGQARPHPTSANSTAPNSEASPSSQQGFLVSPHLKPGSAEARQMTAGSGQRLLGFYVRQCRLTPSLKTLLESCLSTKVFNSSVCLLKWKVTVTPFNR